MSYKVLVIEDELDAMKCVRRSLPDICEIVPKFTKTDDAISPDVDNHTENADYTIVEYTTICKNGLRGETTINRGANKFVVTLKDVLKKTIEDNHEELSAIICDIQLGTDIRGGIDVIQWIRDYDWNNLNVHKDYLKYIPIIAFSSETRVGAYNQTDALKSGATGLVIKKDNIISNETMPDMNLNSLIKNQIDYFKYVKKQIPQRNYFVALSFTSCNTTNGKDIQHREFVEAVAQQLYKTYRKQSVFFDQDKLIEGVTTSKKPDEFTKLYKECCEYIIVFVSSDYNTDKNTWTKEEWKGIREHFNKDGKHVIFVTIEKITKEEFESKLGISQVIWIDANKPREDFYKLLQGKDMDSEKRKDDLSKNVITIYDYHKDTITEYIKKANTIVTNIVNIIVNHINNNEEKDF